MEPSELFSFQYQDAKDNDAFLKLEKKVSADKFWRRPLSI